MFPTDKVSARQEVSVLSRAIERLSMKFRWVADIAQRTDLRSRYVAKGLSRQAGRDCVLFGLDKGHATPDSLAWQLNLATECAFNRAVRRCSIDRSNSALATNGRAYAQLAASVG